MGDARRRRRRVEPTDDWEQLLDKTTGDQVRSSTRNGVVYDESTRVATFSPAAALGNGRRYGATITSAVKDEASNALAQDEAWHFKIAAGQEVHGVSPHMGTV
jgi:hypothetical protein